MISKILRAYHLDHLYEADVASDSVRALENLLSDPFAQSAEVELKKHYDLGRLPPAVIGPLQFYYFCRAAEAYGQSAEVNRKEEANALLRSEAVSSWIATYYNVDREHLVGRLELFKVGTTSYILKGFVDADDTEPARAIKLVKPQFCDNPTICGALDEMVALFRQRTFEDFLPRILGAQPIAGAGEPDGLTGLRLRRHLIMEFLSEGTLRDKFHALASERGLERAKACARLAKNVATQVGSYLTSLRAKKKNHLDLSPDNLVFDGHQLILLDFGFNHLLLGTGTASGGGVERAARYVAPEMKLIGERRNSLEPEDVATVDFYALGTILLELVAACHPELQHADADAFLARTSEGSPAPAIEVLLDRVRDIDPGLGLLLEWMLDRNPATRLFEYVRREGGLSDFTDELILATEQYERHVQTAWLPPIQRWSRNLRSQESEAANNSVLGGLLDALFPSTRLGAGRFFCYSALGGLLVAAYQSFGIHWGLDWRESWPGWIVATSFTFVAVKYYLSLFASMSAEGLDRKTEWVLRLNSVSFVPWILYALMVDPTAYALCCGIGLLFVSLNNYFTIELARKAEHVIHSIGLETPRPMKQAGFLDYYGGWAPLTFTYAVMLFVAHVGMRRGVLKDVSFYAIVIVVLNAKMLVVNCTQDVSKIKSGLTWLFGSYRRALSFGDVTSTAAPAHKVRLVASGQ